MGAFFLLVRTTGLEPARSPTRSLAVRVCQFRHVRTEQRFFDCLIIIPQKYDKVKRFFALKVNFLEE